MITIDQADYLPCIELDFEEEMFPLRDIVLKHIHGHLHRNLVSYGYDSSVQDL